MQILLLAIRSLLCFRLYTVINILVLALSLTCVIIISRYVYNEAIIDHFCTNHERIYLRVRHWPDGKLAPMLCTSDNVLVKKSYQDPLDIERRSSFVSLADVYYTRSGFVQNLTRSNGCSRMQDRTDQREDVRSVKHGNKNRMVR